MKKKPLIFISHSSKNKAHVAKIAELLRSINLSPRRDIFCSSLGSEVVAKEYPDRRQYAIWDEALNACLRAKYIERKSDAICVITNAGYKVVE